MSLSVVAVTAEMCKTVVFPRTETCIARHGNVFIHRISVTKMRSFVRCFGTKMRATGKKLNKSLRA